MLLNKYRDFIVLDKAQFKPEKMRAVAAPISPKGTLMNICTGFIDGRETEICRPKEKQNEVSNGHKRKHALKYQAIVTPDGVTARVSVPFPGSRHDAFLLHETAILRRLRGHLNVSPTEWYAIYGDLAYGSQENLRSPYRESGLPANEQEFNDSMKASRISVEWEFGKTVNLFSC